MLQTSVEPTVPTANSKTTKQNAQSKGHPAAATSLTCVLDGEWLVEHARQVSASLPGGETASDTLLSRSDTPPALASTATGRSAVQLRSSKSQGVTAWDDGLKISLSQRRSFPIIVGCGFG